MTKTSIGIIFGGRSGEHAVSLLSAKEVITALDPEKYTVIPIGIDQQGSWYYLPPHALEQMNSQGLPAVILPDPKIHSLVSYQPQGIDLPTNSKAIDVIFPLLHGPYGEDGTIQGLLELAGIPYIGSGVLASAVGMDKAAMKAIFQQQGLPVTPYRVYLRHEWEENPDIISDECKTCLPSPWFIKPANLGSSVGISKVHQLKEFAAAVDLALQYDRKIIVEASVEQAREIEFGILGNEQPQVSVAGEIITVHEFYHYQAKYADPSLMLQIPAKLSDSILTQMQSIALKAYKAIDCAGLARVDFLLRRTDQTIFLSEINTMPGFTQVSMYPKLWNASGIPYPELIDRLIKLALNRHHDKQKNQLFVPQIT